MSSSSVVKAPLSTSMPRVLVVDDEADILTLFRDTLAGQIECKLLTAATLAAARRIIASEKIDVLLVDLTLPDGDGLTLLPELREKNPAARAVVITGDASIDNTIGALRAGVIDFVCKPFKMDQLVKHVERAIERQTMIARNEKRLDRLKDAVRRLNQSRKVVSRKVDLLCNDLISAYGDVAKQVEDVRNQESFRKLIDSSKDLEQMLCHAMDWILRQCGYCNLAIWLAADDSDYQLGAYMKYTLPGEPALTDALKQNLVPMIARDGLVHLEGYDVKKHLSASEYKFMQGQTIVGANCTYLGESLGVLAMFRDEKSPFNDEDLAMLKAITPVFATALTAMVRRQDGEDGDEYGDAGGTAFDDKPADDKPQDKPSKSKKQKKQDYDADWWKRGEPPPF